LWLKRAGRIAHEDPTDRHGRNGRLLPQSRPGRDFPLAAEACSVAFAAWVALSLSGQADLLGSPCAQLADQTSTHPGAGA
jgi:hypothetical protein